MAAITCKQLRLDAKAQTGGKELSPQQQKNYLSSILNEASTKHNPCPVVKSCKAKDMEEGLSFVRELAALADEAISTSIWCTVSLMFNSWVYFVWLRKKEN